MGFGWAEARDVAKHPIILVTFPITRNSPAPSVRSAEVERAWCDV